MTPVPPVSPALRRFLYLTAAVAGAAVMVVEILGARILAPTLGTSHYVWTAQIAVTLLSLALGYHQGGRLVDRSPDLDQIYGALLAAALYLPLSLVLCPRLATMSMAADVAFGPLLVSLVLFLVPLTCLAMVGPFLVRLLGSSVDGIGGQVGRLSAVSTLGSFAGTVFIGWIAIPRLANSVSLLLTSAALVLLSLGWFLGFRRRAAPSGRALVAALVVAGLGAWARGAEVGPLPAHLHERARGNSPFGLMQVIDDDRDGSRYFLTDAYPHNHYAPAARAGADYYIYAVHALASAYLPAPPRRTLVIGMGVGLGPGWFAAHGSSVDIVEINPAVVPMAERWFDFDPSRFALHLEDGRTFLSRQLAAPAASRERWDCVVLDAFAGDTLPTHLMTREAYTAIREVLAPGGVMVMNTNLFGRRDDFLGASLERTLREVFPGVAVHDSGSWNVFYVARNGALDDGAAVQLPLAPDVPAAFAPRVRGVLDHRVRTDPARGRVLTDDDNPAEFQDAGPRLRFHRALAMRLVPWDSY